MDELIVELRSINAFEALDDTVLSLISDWFVTKSYQKGESIIFRGDEPTGVYFLIEGTLRTTMYSPQGREISCQDLDPGEMFGELGVIDQLPRSTHVISLQQSRVLWLSNGHFIELIQNYPSVSRATLSKMAGLIRFLCERVYEYGALDVNQRIRAELLRLAGPNPGGGSNSARIMQPPKHQEFANRLSTHREAVSRELKRLEKLNIIRKDKQCLIIDDLAALRQLVEE